MMDKLLKETPPFDSYSTVDTSLLAGLLLRSNTPKQDNSCDVTGAHIRDCGYSVSNDAFAISGSVAAETVSASASPNRHFVPQQGSHHHHQPGYDVTAMSAPGNCCVVSASNSSQSGDVSSQIIMCSQQLHQQQQLLHHQQLSSSLPTTLSNIGLKADDFTASSMLQSVSFNNPTSDWSNLVENHVQQNWTAFTKNIKSEHSELDPENLLSTCFDSDETDSLSINFDSDRTQTPDNSSTTSYACTDDVTAPYPMFSASPNSLVRIVVR